MGAIAIYFVHNVIVPFWFSMDHFCTALTPFWVSSEEIILKKIHLAGVFLIFKL